ncbi:hypothetical protein AAFF_G00342270 [Aldrovandia affinis]|uniref:Uncharacterized protein n=1 Tax=Aldrovandia affinis TaxID=143900 RepID=A0AAD7R689_9TELE|nr:hypothetical protein AAFF_G00342270 [Aldrovandia affinis]
MISGLTPGDPALSMDTGAVVRCFKRTQVNKAPGSDNICGHALKYCAEELGGVFQPLRALLLLRESFEFLEDWSLREDRATFAQRVRGRRRERGK